MHYKKLFSTGLSYLWITLLLIALDRITKFWIIHHLEFFYPYQIFSFFNLTLVYNTGAAFSFLNKASGWQNLLLGSLAFVVSLVILYWLYSLSVRDRWINIALCLVLGGALGNAWDRLLYQHVIDFFDFHWGVWHFAIFNIADSAISIGATMLIIYWLWQKSRTKLDGQ